ncbi:MAG: hypothetical protein J3K34DRAFT_419500, partial [Monoraphidium minutum]
MHAATASRAAAASSSEARPATTSWARCSRVLPRVLAALLRLVGVWADSGLPPVVGAVAPAKVALPAAAQRGADRRVDCSRGAAVLAAHRQQRQRAEPRREAVGGEGALPRRAVEKEGGRRHVALAHGAARRAQLDVPAAEQDALHAAARRQLRAAVLVDARNV